jgi:hypothetical protein
MRSILLAAIGCLALVAGEAPTVDGIITRFEAQVASDFVPVQQGLDQWRTRRAQTAMNELQGLFAKATPEDQVVIAYHLLEAKPTHKQARELFTKAGLTPPFDDKGVAAAGWTMPATRNRALADKIANLAYPPFDVVRDAIDPKSSTVSGFWKRQAAQQDKLRSDLVGLAKQGQADVVYPLLAYYQPDAAEVRMYFQSRNKPVPRQRTWFSPVDQWLLDHELAGIDCLAPVVPVRQPKAAVSGQPVAIGDRGWSFPELLPAWRVECAATWTGRVGFLIIDDKGSGVRLRLDQRAATVEIVGVGAAKLGDFTLDHDPATVPMPLQFEVRGTAVVLRAGGAVIGTASLPRTMAFRQFGLEGTLAATQLRLRFLADLPENALLTGDVAALPAKPAAPVAPPAEPAWKAERDAQLAKPVSFVFADTSLEEAAGMLSRLSGATFTLAPSAEALKDLPVSMKGDELRLQTALEWMQRLTDVVAVPTEQGFSLEWKR